MNGFGTSARGLTQEEALRHQEVQGLTVLAEQSRFAWLRLFLRALVNPLVIL